MNEKFNKLYIYTLIGGEGSPSKWFGDFSWTTPIFIDLSNFINMYKL